MEQVFHHFQRDPTVTSSPTEVRLWIEGLDYNFLVYGEIFEREGINGERLLNITGQRLTELGINQTDHQDILLEAVANIFRKSEVEDQAMQEEDQNDKKMPTRFGKQSEHLEHAIDRVLVMISERRRARSLHGIVEQPPHNILTAALELTNMVKMILNTLERPPFDCMSEFFSLKSHLIKHITLLKYFSEQSDLSHEMESDIIDVCKGVTKICHYIIALPPDIPGTEIQIPAFRNPEERPPRVQVPINIEHEAMSFTMEKGPDYMPPTQYPSMQMTTTSASEPISSFQDVSLPNEKVPNRFNYFSPERLNTPINEEADMLRHDGGNKSETEVSDTKGSVTLDGSLDYKSLQDLTIIESDTPLMDSGSERCVIDSDSDRGIGSDYDLEKHSKCSDSVIWGIDSDSETCARDLASRNNLLEAKRYQMASGSEEDLLESEQHLVKVDQCQADSDSLKHWMDSGSEKCLVDSDSEKYLMDSDNERLGIDSDSEKCPMASTPEKLKLKAEKRQMASDSIKRLMESEKRLMDNEKLWMVSASKTYVMDPETERGGMNSDSKSKVHLMGDEKHEKISSKRYMMDSDSEPCGMDSDTERYELASATEKYLMDPKTFQLSTDSEGFWIDSWSERHAIDLNSESLEMASDSLKHMRKAKTCQSVCDLERFCMGKSESERNMTDSEKEQSDFDHGRYWDSPRKYQHNSVKLQDISDRCEDDSQNLQHDLDKDKADSHYEKHHTNSANERHQNEFESKIHLMEMEREQFENVKLQVNEESESHADSERHHLNSENEAQRLGARRKENRPQGFWRPVSLPPPVFQGKVTKEQYSIQQKIESKVSRIQLVKYLSDDKIVRFKEVSPTLSQKQASQQNLKEKHSNISSDPNTFMDDKHERKASCKISFYKSHCKTYRYAHNFQSSGSQSYPIHLSAEGYSSGVSAPVCNPNSISPTSVVCPKTQRNNIPFVDIEAKRCFKCFMEITNPPFHKCVMNYDDDSDPDCPLHLQIPLDSKYSLSPKSVRHYETYRYSPSSQTLDYKGPVTICCPLHQEESKYSLGSTYVHHESCSAFQNLISSITYTFPINSENTMGHHSTSDPDTVINSCNVTGVESEHKFNLTAKPKNESNPDNDTEIVSTRNLNIHANAKDKPLPKDEIDHITDNNSEDETDAEEETDPEDENNTKEKKDPKDKSDSDDKDPKGSNSEYDANNHESDPSGDAGPTSGTDSSRDGDPNNGTNPNSETDRNIDNSTNNDGGSKYSTDPEEDVHTNNSHSASVLVDQDNTANSNNDTNPNYTSGTQNRTCLVYTSCSNNGAGLSNATKPGNDICPNIDPGFHNIRSTTNNLCPTNCDFGPKNFPNPNNTPVPQKDPDSNYNVIPSNATSNNNAIIPNNDTDLSYDTRPTSATGHNYTAAPHHDSDHDYVPELTHAEGSSFAANPNYIDRNSYAARSNSAASTVTFTDTSNTISYSSAVSPRYNTGTNYDSDTNHITRFTHFIDSTIVANTNYNAINMQNAHNSANTSNNLSGPELEISSNTYVPNNIYGNSPTFAASTSYISTPKNLTTSKFSDSSKLGRNYTIFDEQKCQAPFKVSASSMDSATFMHGIVSKDFLDAKESGFSKDSSGLQNTIGIKDPVSSKIPHNSSIPLPSFDIIVEAETPDVVKFAISSDALKQIFKLLNHYDSALRAEGESFGGPIGETTRRSFKEPVLETMEGPATIPERVLPVQPKRSRAFMNFFMKAKAQRWLDLSWFRRVLPSFFSEEDQYFYFITRFCAVACTELGRRKCEGWLWKKGESRGISFSNWKRYWFILKHSTLYWFSHPNDTNTDGFIYLPEFRIGLTQHCRRNHWVSQMLQLTYGSSFGDAAANGEYRSIGTMIYAKCVLALKRDFPVIRCDNCHEATTIVSMNPNFQYRPTQNVSDEFIYFHPIDAEIREKARRQKQQKPTMASHQQDGEGIHQRDQGIISQVVMVTTPPLTELESIVLVRPKTSGLLRLEKIPVKSPEVPESQRLDVTGIASPEERGKGTAILVAGVPGKEELDDTEIPTLKFTGLIHLEALIKKCSPSSEYGCPRTPRNLWLESPENAESPGSDDLEVARSMYPLRERSIFRHSWAELLEAPLNSEGLHIVQNIPTEEDKEIGYLQIAPEEKNQTIIPPRDPYLHPLQGPFPQLPQRPKLQQQHSLSLPQYSDGSREKLKAHELTLNPEEKRFFPSDHNLLTGGNAKERDRNEESWQKAILSDSGEHPPINPSFEYSTKQSKIGIPKDNAGLLKDNVRIPSKNVMINVGVPIDNSEVLTSNAGVFICNPEIPSGSDGVPWGSGVGVPMDNVDYLRHNVGTSRHTVSSLLTELSKIGEHQL